MIRNAFKYLPRRKLILAFAISFALFLLVGTSYWVLEEKISDIQDSKLILASNIEKILRLDEVLTMSARMAAATGDSRYIDRYHKYNPELDQLIDSTQQLFPDKKVQAAIKSTAQSNQALVQMELKSFVLVKDQKRKEALALLSSPEYLKQKKIYSRGMQITSSAIQDAQTQKEFNGKIYFTVLMGMAFCGMMFTIFISLYALITTLRETQEKEKVQETLLKSLSQFRQLMDQSNDSIVIADPETARIIDANAKTCTALGYSSEELFTKTIPDIVVFPEAFSWKDVIKDIKSKEYVLIVTRHRRKDGSTYPVEVNVRYISQKEGHSLVAVVRDITERKRVEAQLQLYKTAPEEAANGVILCDTLGTIISVNKAFTKITGYAEEEVIGKSTSILKSGKHDKGFYENLWQTVLSGKVWKGEMINRKKNGELYAEEMTITPVHSTGHEITHFIAFKQDITERKSAERQVRETKQMYRQILDAISDFVLVKGEKSKIQWANKAFRDYYGMDNKELKDIIDAPFNDPDNTQQYVKDDAYVFNTGKDLNIPQEPVKRIDGAVRLFHTVKSPILNNDGKIIMTVGVSRDITERKKTEEAILREKEHTEHIIESAPTLICGIGPDGTTLFANQAIVKATGYSKEEIVGKNWWNTFYPGEEYRQVEQLLKDFEKGPVANYEMTLTTKHGEKRRISWNSVNRIASDGTLIEIIGIGADITDQKHLEQMLLQSEKMSAVGQLAAGVAHEINNPLGVILGFSQTMAGRLGPNDPYELPVKSIEREATRCKHLVQDLLLFSRTSRAGQESIDINKAVEATIPLIIAQGNVRKVEIVSNIAAHLPSVMGNFNQVQQVLLNLANNAMDAMPNGGTLKLEMEEVKERSASWITLKVSDTGEGIPPEIIDRVFEPFFTTKPVGKGTGLGLSLVYEILQKHSATINIESRPGFTQFTLKFPAMSCDLRSQTQDSKESLI